MTQYFSIRIDTEVLGVTEGTLLPAFLKTQWYLLCNARAYTVVPSKFNSCFFRLQIYNHRSRPCLECKVVDGDLPDAEYGLCGALHDADGGGHGSAVPDAQILNKDSKI